MPQEDSSATSGTTTSAARLSVNPPAAPNNGNNSNNNSHIQTKSQHNNKNKSKHALELKACQHKLHLHNRPEPMSCHHCRVSKVACDKKRPCSTCIRKGKSCYDYIKPNKDQNLTGGNPSAGNIWQRGKKKNHSPGPATTGQLQQAAIADDSVQQHPQQSSTHKRNPIIFVEQFPHIQLQPSKKRKMDLSQTVNRHISSRVVNSSDDSTKNKELGGPNNTAELYHHTSTSTSTTTSASTMTTQSNYNNNSHSCTTTSTTTMNNNNINNNLFFSSSSSSNREFQSPSSLSSSSCSSSSSNSTTPPLSNNEYDSIDSIISVDSPGSFQLGLETSSSISTSPSLPMPISDSTMNMILGSSSSLSGFDSIELNQHNNHIVPLSSSSLSSSYAMTMPNHYHMNQTNHDNHTIYMNHALSSPYLFIPTTINDFTTVVYNNNNNNNNNSSSNTMMTMHPHHHNNNMYQNRNHTLYNPMNNNNSNPTAVLHTNSMINNNNNIAPLVDYDEDDIDDKDIDDIDDDIVNNQITSLELEIEEMQRTLHTTRRNNEALEEKIRVMQRELQPLKAGPRDFNLDPVDMWNPPLNTRKAVLMWDRSSWEIFGCNQVFRDMFRYSRAELQGESPSILSTRISQSLWKDFVNNVWAATAHNVARHGFLVTKDGIVLSTQIHCRIENSFLLVEFELTDVVHDEVVLDDVVYPRTFQIPVQKYAMAATTTEAMSITRMLNIFWNARERITNPVIRQRQEREISKVLALVGGQRLSDEPAQDSEENKQDKCS